METIEIKNLKKYFGTTKAVDGISFEIKEGEIFGFLGPNGAGKTTTISMMMDFLKPTDGNVYINGIDANINGNSPELKKVIGYISADARFYEDMRARDHFKLISELRGKSSNLTELLSDFDFNPDKKPRELSTGNRQKLAIIMALMHEPKILILDEPTRGLDPLFQNVFFKWLEKLNKKGTTIFMSSHNLVEVQNICNTVAVIKEGKIVALEDVKSMRIKKMNFVEVEFGDDFKKADFENNGFEIVEAHDKVLKIKVAGEMDPLVKILAKYKVIDLQISHASLEEIFMEYYK